MNPNKNCLTIGQEPLHTMTGLTVTQSVTQIFNTLSWDIPSDEQKKCPYSIGEKVTLTASFNGSEKILFSGYISHIFTKKTNEESIQKITAQTPAAILTQSVKALSCQNYTLSDFIQEIAEAAGVDLSDNFKIQSTLQFSELSVSNEIGGIRSLNPALTSEELALISGWNGKLKLLPMVSTSQGTPVYFTQYELNLSDMGRFKDISYSLTDCIDDTSLQNDKCIKETISPPILSDNARKLFIRTQNENHQAYIKNKLLKSFFQHNYLELILKPINTLWECGQVIQLGQAIAGYEKGSRFLIQSVGLKMTGGNDIQATLIASPLQDIKL